MKEYKPTLFEIEDKYEIDPEAIDDALTEANRYIDNQVATTSKTQASASTLVSILSAIIAATIGILLTCPASMPYCTVLLGISILPMFALLFGTMFRKTVFYAGDPPTHFLDSNTLKWAESHQNEIALTVPYILKLLHLEELQFRILRNDELQESITFWYRLALLFMAESYTAAFVTLVILLLI